MHMYSQRPEKSYYIGHNAAGTKFSMRSYVVISTVDVRPMFKEELCDLFVAMLCGTVKWCSTLHATRNAMKYLASNTLNRQSKHESV